MVGKGYESKESNDRYLNNQILQVALNIDGKEADNGNCIQSQQLTPNQVATQVPDLN